MSVILLAGASLAVRGFLQMLDTDPGFQPSRVLSVEVTLPPKSYPTWQQRNELDRNLLASITSLPGVQDAELGNSGLPYAEMRSGFTIAGQPRMEGRNVAIALISQRYPQTLGIPLKRGREFTEVEIERGMHVALINESAARICGRLVRIRSVAPCKSALWARRPRTRSCSPLLASLPA